HRLAKRLFRHLSAVHPQLVEADRGVDRPLDVRNEVVPDVESQPTQDDVPRSYLIVTIPRIPARQVAVDLAFLTTAPCVDSELDVASTRVGGVVPLGEHVEIAGLGPEPILVARGRKHRRPGVVAILALRPLSRSDACVDL